MKAEVTEYRVGRNFIRVGDTVKVKSRPGKRDAHLARVRRIITVEGEVVEIEVVGPKGFRTFLPERIERVAQTKGGEKVARKR